MRSVGLILLAMVLFLLAGCKEQETKSKERGKAVMGNIKEVEQKARDAASKMQKDVSQLEHEDK